MKVVYVSDQENASMNESLQYASWLLSLRTGVDVDYIGWATEEPTWLGDKLVVVRQATTTEWVALGNTPQNPIATTITYENDHRDVLYNAYQMTAELSVPLHELGHALGYHEHSESPIDLMYSITKLGQDYFYPLTTEDMEVINGNLDSVWPVVDTPDTNSAILLPDNDLFIPDIQGHMAYLNYTGHQQWEVVMSDVNPDGGTSGDRILNGVAYINSVQSIGDDYASVELVAIDETHWQLGSAL